MMLQRSAGWRGVWVVLAIGTCAASIAVAADVPLEIEALEPLAPIPEAPPRSKVFEARARLGQRLFWDPRLSVDGKMTCARCHDTSSPILFGTDGQARSPSPYDTKRTPTNSPTIFNSHYSARQTWGGSMKSVHDVLLRPFTRPVLMGWTKEWEEPTEKGKKGGTPRWEEEIISRLREDKQMAAAFREAFPENPEPRPIAPGNVFDALAAYIEAIVPRNARFDQYLRGDTNKLTEQEVRGYRMFIDYGCAACHQGRNVGGNMVAPFGQLRSYFDDHRYDFELDGGMAKDLKLNNVPDWQMYEKVFRVPSLRNVERTAPYFHNGSEPSLPEAVRTMAKYQLGRTLRSDDVDAIVAFLTTLTGEPPAGLAGNPASEGDQP